MDPVWGEYPVTSTVARPKPSDFGPPGPRAPPSAGGESASAPAYTSSTSPQDSAHHVSHVTTCTLHDALKMGP